MLRHLVCCLVSPFWVGTLCFIALGLFACFVSNALSRVGKNSQLGLTYVMITMTTVCTWMLWGMAWLMQWHPLIAPIKEAGAA